SKPLSVIVLGASEKEREALLEPLRAADYAPTAVPVATRAELESALARDKVDLVLAEYAGPGLSALEALAVLKERELDLPFIIVSDHIGEETAIRAIKAGANNCIQRDALGRLGLTVERELGEAQVRRERRQAQKALRESETRFRTLAETASDAILTVDDAGRIVFANRAAESIFGHPVAALIGQPVAILLPEYARALSPSSAGDPA